MQRHVPFQEAALGVHFIEKRHLLGQRDHEASAQFSEVIQEVERVRAVAQDLAVELDVKLPSGPRLRSGSLFLDPARFELRAPVRLDQAMQIVENGIADDGIGGFRRFDQGADVILGGQRYRNEILIWPDLALAHPVKGGFEFMREVGNVVEAEHRARPLDGMQRAEGGVDKLSVIRTKAEIQQGSFQGVEQFARFLSKYLGGIQCRHDRASLLTTARSCSCLNGLVIQPVAPAFFASCLTASLDSVVRNTIRRPSKAGNARSARINSRPFMTGMFRSVMTRSRRLDLAFSSPWAPSLASITLCPAGASVTLII